MPDIPRELPGAKRDRGRLYTHCGKCGADIRGKNRAHCPSPTCSWCKDHLTK